METTLRTQTPRSRGTATADGAAEAPLPQHLLRKMDAYWRAANRDAFHQGQADHLRLSRLPLADPPLDLSPHQPQEPARTRLERG
jgi:hypothetical protein